MVKMETDTLSNYEQPQDKHILDDSMDINIPRNDEITDSRQVKETNSVNSDLRLKDTINSDNTENHKVNCESSENKENESDSDQHITNTNDSNHLNNEIGNDKDSETENEKETIESEEKSPANNIVNDDECSNNTEDANSRNEEEKESLDDVDKDPLNVDEDAVNKNDESESEQNKMEKDPLADADTEEKDAPSDSIPSENTDIQKDSKKEDSSSLSSQEDKGENIIDMDITKNITDTDKGSNEDCKDSKESNETEVTEDGKNKDDSVKDNGTDCPLLKETLTKARSDDDDQQKETENGMEDIDMDEDFDPSLLCPDIAMEVDEAPVITSNEIPPSDGNKSPLLYEPIFSQYVDEMTGAEVSFNLSVEEHKLRQETFGEANPVQFTKVHCTACNVHLGSALDGQSNRFVHPLLKVLICKDCYHFYTSGEFEKDEDGSELYCRWCGQGGQVICCSSCEMVFCKKCIRINFGRKKLTEIRDSDEWLCFRCDPSQLIHLRVHCAEFMEYVRREISRAATLENATSFTTTDYTQCCLSQKKKYVDPHATEPKKKKRKTSINDPDYDPMKDRSLSPQPGTSTAGTPVVAETTPQKLVAILPKPATPTQNTTPVSQNSVFRVGNTTFRPRGTTFSQPRPRVQVINPTSTSNIRPQISGPGYIKIMPGGIRVPPSPMRNQAQTFVSSSTRQPSFQHRPIRPSGNNQMKHEWFEKTVRAAARVNSNLSYTLTQLNRAQANATSVEALAVVHNKLQEILSTSINSLIQIRKNLRTEFIAGIKNIRFPPKPQPQPQPSTSAQDDDVIFVSPNTSLPPPLMHAGPSTSGSPLTSINLPPSVSLTKRAPFSSVASSPASRPSTSNGDEKPKVFLRVKSLTALQNVPSECITIPDDPLPPPPPLTPISKLQEITIIDNSPEKNGEKQGEKNQSCVEVMDVTSTTEESSEKKLETKPTEDTVEPVVDSTNGDKEDGSSDVVENAVEEVEKTVEEVKEPEEVIKPEEVEKPEEVKKPEEEIKPEEEQTNSEKAQDDNRAVAFDAENTSSRELKKMFNIKIHIMRSEEVEAKIKQLFGLVNGDSSE